MVVYFGGEQVQKKEFENLELDLDIDADIEQNYDEDYEFKEVDDIDIKEKKDKYTCPPIIFNYEVIRETMVKVQKSLENVYMSFKQVHPKFKISEHMVKELHSNFNQYAYE